VTVPATPVRVLARDQLEMLLGAIPDGPYQSIDRALWTAGGFAGLRLGELLELRWGCIDWIDQRIAAPGRFVPMHDRVGAAIDGLSDAREAHEQLVFRDPASGNALDRRQILLRLRAVCARPGIPPPLTFDELRTGFTVACLQGGVSLAELACWLGVRLGALEPFVAFAPSGDPAREVHRVFGELGGATAEGGRTL